MNDTVFPNILKQGIIHFLFPINLPDLIFTGKIDIRFSWYWYVNF